ncbi:CheY-like chemotaxis protein [Bradyrhizobium sp. RT6a]|uniref:response regulator n=1 Tax=Bradyrhizobium sp. RT6a TaxID=3156381 RepID=UPI00339A5275
MNACSLLVEDDSLQREILADLLKDEGFEVVECTTAEAAELIVASTGSELPALVTDQNLAGAMTGRELAEYAREKYPSMNIILMFGSIVKDLPPNTTFLQAGFDSSVAGTGQKLTTSPIYLAS